MFLRVLRALRGMICPSMLLNDPGMLYRDEPKKTLRNSEVIGINSSDPGSWISSLLVIQHASNAKKCRNKLTNY